MSFISKLKPRIKPRLGLKVAEATALTRSADTTVNVNEVPTFVGDAGIQNAKTSSPIASLAKDISTITAPDGLVRTDPVVTESKETSTPSAKPISNEEDQPSSNVSQFPELQLPAKGISAVQKFKKLETQPDSTRDNKLELVDHFESVDSQTINSKYKDSSLLLNEKPKPGTIYPITKPVQTHGLKFSENEGIVGTKCISLQEEHVPSISQAITPSTALEAATTDVTQLGDQPSTAQDNKPKLFDSLQPTDSKSKDASLLLRKKTKPRIIKPVTKPVIKKHVRPCSSSGTTNKNEPTVIPQTTTVNEGIKLGITNHLATSCITETLCPDGSGLVSNKNEEKYIQTHGLKFGENDGIVSESNMLKEEHVSSVSRTITSSMTLGTATKDLGLQNNLDESKSIKRIDAIKKHPLIKPPPKMLRKGSIQDIGKSMTYYDSEEPSPTNIDAAEKVSLGSHDGDEHTRISTVESGMLGEQDVENVSYNDVPIVDTTKNKNQQSSDVAPLIAVNSNTGNITSSIPDKNYLKDERELPSKSNADKTKIGSTKAKLNKTDPEDVRMHYAMSAIDYLRRHDHALGDSIIRRLIIGNKNMKNRNLKATMCSSCNPQTLKRCLASLCTLQGDELQALLHKSAERQKAPISFANFIGKPLFKPSLGRTKESSKMDSDENSPKSGSSSSPSSSRKMSIKEGSSNSSDLSDSDPDDPEDEVGDTKAMEIPNRDDNEQNNTVPVPQVKIGDEGQIILAPESLVLKQKESEVENIPVVHETDFAGLGRKKDNLNRTAWSFEETVKFYKALHGMGTDFTSMLTYFPNRTRKNLKSKFKREERKNSALIDKVLSAQGQTFCIADVEKYLGADKTLKRLCIETAARKYSPSNTIGSGLNRRRKKNCFREDDNEPSRMLDAGESKPVLASTIPSRPERQRMPKLEKNNNEKENEDETCAQTPPPRKNHVEPENKEPEPADTFKKPVGCPPTQRKRKLNNNNNKTVPNILKKVKRSKPKEKIQEPPRIHTICLDNFGDDEGDDSSLDSITFEDNSDDCFVIETNYENKAFNCIKSVKFSVDNPDCPVDVNATIEHKPARDDPPIKIDTEEDESSEEVQVVTININQLPFFLEETGAIVIEHKES